MKIIFFLVVKGNFLKQSVYVLHYAIITTTTTTTTRTSDFLYVVLLIFNLAVAMSIVDHGELTAPHGKVRKAEILYYSEMYVTSSFYKKLIGAGLCVSEPCT